MGVIPACMLMNTAFTQCSTLAEMIRVPLTTTTSGLISCRMSMVSSEFTDRTFIKHLTGSAEQSNLNSWMICRILDLDLHLSHGMTVVRNATWPRVFRKP